MSASAIVTADSLAVTADSMMTADGLPVGPLPWPDMVVAPVAWPAPVVDLLPWP